MQLILHERKGVQLKLKACHFEFIFEFALISFAISCTDMFDRNHTGSIDIYEFGDLFNYINQWKALFESIDRDRSGYIEFGELSQGRTLD